MGRWERVDESPLFVNCSYNPEIAANILKNDFPVRSTSKITLFNGKAEEHDPVDDLLDGLFFQCDCGAIFSMKRYGIKCPLCGKMFLRDDERQ